MSTMAPRPDMENLLEQFMFKTDTPLDLEEVVVPRVSWMALKRLKETHLSEIAPVHIVGITEKGGKFISMPNGNTVVTSESRLLIIGTSQGIRSAKKIILKHEKPEELKYV